MLYVDSGSERNTLPSMPDDYITDRAVIKRFNLASSTGKPFAWESGEVFVRGARNVTGFTRDSKGRMYGVINGFDDMRFHGEDIHPDNPGEYVAQLEVGQAYGWPFCFAAQRVTSKGEVVAPGTPLRAEEYKDTPLNHLVESTKDDAWCQAHMTKPMSFVQAHSAPLDIVVDEGPEGALPARYRGGAFISTHGSWDRSPSTETLTGPRSDRGRRMRDGLGRRFSRRGDDTAVGQGRKARSGLDAHGFGNRSRTRLREVLELTASEAATDEAVAAAIERVASIKASRRDAATDRSGRMLTLAPQRPMKGGSPQCAKPRIASFGLLG